MHFNLIQQQTLLHIMLLYSLEQFVLTNNLFLGYDISGIRIKNVLFYTVTTQSVDGGTGQKISICHPAKMSGGQLSNSYKKVFLFGKQPAL